jgi:hypothetical protein
LLLARPCWGALGVLLALLASQVVALASDSLQASTVASSGAWSGSVASLACSIAAAVVALAISSDT